MKLPAKIVTRHKVRDAKICMLYANGTLSQQQIAQRFKMSQTRVSSILFQNLPFLETQQAWEKTKRVAHLKRLLNDHPDRLTKNKGTLDILDQIRAEHEGKSGQSVNVGVTVVMNNVTVNQQPLEYDLGDHLTRAPAHSG